MAESELKDRSYTVTAVIKPSDVREVTQVYVAAFPNQVRVRLGQRVCREYIRGVLEDENYLVCVAHACGQVAGFAFVKLVPGMQSKRRWIVRAFPFLLLGALKNPGLMLSCTAKKVLAKLPQSKSRPEPSTNTCGRPDMRCHLEFIGVAPEWRNKGVASVLINECIRLLNNRGCATRLQLTVDANNRSAIRLYEKLGFRPVTEQLQTAVYEKHF